MKPFFSAQLARHSRWILLCAGLAFGGVSQAAPSEESPIFTTTEAETKTFLEGTLSKEVFGVRPQLGALLYEDMGGEDSTRMMIGLMLDSNAMAVFKPSLRNWYVGPSTGIFFSHLGSASAGFFGVSEPGSDLADANLVMIPVNLKMGYTFGKPHFRLALHGGVNLVYRSNSRAVRIGETRAGEASWVFFPNIGADVEVAVTEAMALILRPDLTISSDQEMFSGMLGVAFPLG